MHSKREEIVVVVVVMIAVVTQKNPKMIISMTQSSVNRRVF